MEAVPEISQLDDPKHCPICGNHMHTTGIERVAWTSQTRGERHIFSCERCGVSQTVWNTALQVAGENA